MKSRPIGKDPDAGKDGRQREKEWQRMRWSDGIADSVDASLNALWETLQGGGAWCAAVLGAAKTQTHLSDYSDQLPLRLLSSASQGRAHSVYSLSV